jgi:hypothetical protein
MAELIRFALSNFTLTLLIVGVIAAGIDLMRRPRPWSRPEIIEALLAYFLLFSVGVSFFYNFVMHVFFGEMAARFIGWADSPFQAEVGYASLGFSILGFLAFRGSNDMRFAAVLGPAAFLWGAAAGHIHQIMTTGNLAAGNAGPILYTDILLPVIGLVLVWLAHKHPAPAA